jgi:NAD(P)-dependent dehydrogenase (short-subunit alcohol dehydrogenase family)
MRLEGKKALVTGGSLGLGRAIALAYAAEGADVAVTGRHAETLEPVAQEIRARGRRAHVMEWDIADVPQAEPRLAEAREALAGLDVLVNNAGVTGKDGSHFPDTTPANWDFVMGINLRGLYFACQAAVKDMAAAGGGVIVNIASDAGLRPEVNAYGLSKWGVVGLTRGMKCCMADGVRVNAIAPGACTTRLMGWEEGRSTEFPNLPLGRMTLCDEVADVAVFLASEESKTLVGQVVVLNSASA